MFVMEVREMLWVVADLSLLEVLLEVVVVPVRVAGSPVGPSRCWSSSPISLCYKFVVSCDVGGLATVRNGSSCDAGSLLEVVAGVDVITDSFAGPRVAGSCSFLKFCGPCCRC